MFGKCLAVFAAALMVSAPAAAETKAKKKLDPNEVVCQKVEQLGSRLSSKKICKTRAEWAEQRRLDRQDISKGQTTRWSCEGCQ